MKSWQEAREAPHHQRLPREQGPADASRACRSAGEPASVVSNRPCVVLRYGRGGHSYTPAPDVKQRAVEENKKEMQPAQGLEESKEETGRNASSASSSLPGQEAVALVAESRLLPLTVLLAGVRGVGRQAEGRRSGLAGPRKALPVTMSLDVVSSGPHNGPGGRFGRAPQV